MLYILPPKPFQIDISKEKWIEAKHIIKNKIIKKRSASKKNMEIDTEIAAGMYVYALEEFGKLLLLKESKAVNGKYVIIYRDGFVNHNAKFNKAFDHLQNKGYSE
jgi:hypothetical protein